MNASAVAITFDIGGTLLRPWPSVGEVYARTAYAYGVDAAPDVLEKRFREAFMREEAAATGRIDEESERLKWRRVVEHCFSDAKGWAACGDAVFAALWDVFAAPQNWRELNNHTVEILRELRARGFRLGVVSNFDSRLHGLLEGFGWRDCFDVVVLSTEAHAAKPDPAIYEEAARRLDVAASAIVHVGDSEKADVEGARAAGFRARLVEPGKLREVLCSLDEEA